MIYLEGAGDVAGTNPASTPKKLFVDLINRSPEGVGIQTEKKIKPAASDYQFFRKTDLIKSISRDAVCPLLNCITFRYVKAGQRFISQGQPGDTCFIIQKGTCAINVEKDGELIPVARLQEGDIAGEMALITGEPRSAHVDA
jgi:hypothetical protein